MAIGVDTRAGREGLRLAHVTRRDPVREAHVTRRDPVREVACIVPLEPMPLAYGGLRWWFRCPSMGRRCGRLYLPRGGTWFACRQAYRMIHDVAHEAKEDRLWRKMAKIARRLGDPDPSPSLPPRPPRMQQRTYERFEATWNRAVEARNVIWNERLARLVFRGTDLDEVAAAARLIWENRPLPRCVRTHPCRSTPVI